jgi:hypothetical protein
MPDALCQAMRSKTATPDNVAWQTSHAAVSSNAEVNCDPALAQGTAATTTPCSAHTTREHLLTPLPGLQLHRLNHRVLGP